MFFSSMEGSPGAHDRCPTLKTLQTSTKSLQKTRLKAHLCRADRAPEVI